MTEDVQEYLVDNEQENEIVKHPKDVIKTIKSYFQGWKTKDWGRMLRASTLTFSRFNKEKYFDDWFGSIKLVSFGINEEVVKDSVPAIADVEVTVTIKIGKETIDKTCIVRMVQEKEAYLPSVNGIWGVNPPSSLRAINTDIPVITDKQ